MSAIHDFSESLALSHEYEDAPWWAEVYGSAFPNLANMVSVRNDGWAQRGGIDRVLTLTSGKTLTVDEKVRSVAYPDILLEVFSSYEHQTPGWIRKDLACDYIAYAFVPIQTCYLFPFLTLRKVWLDNAAEWWPASAVEGSGFKRIEAKNKGYTTVSVAVPTDTLLAAMSAAMTVRWYSPTGGRAREFPDNRGLQK